MKVNRTLALSAASALLVLAGLGSSPALAQQTANGAQAELRDANGTAVGKATLVSDGSGKVRLQVQLQGFTSAAPGDHGIHIHAVGKCEAPQFTTAGGHFNPAGKKHGFNSPEGAHAGDLPNISIGADGTASYETAVEAVSLDPGAANTIFDADGSAVVIHAGPDDYATDPAGNSGARIACGVLNTAVIPTGMPRTGDPGAILFYLWFAVGAAFLTVGLVTTMVMRDRKA